jgi:hypothetical protein
MPVEMIIKLLSLLASYIRLHSSAIRPHIDFKKQFEWQAEFLFIPEKRPFLPVSSRDLVRK